MTPSATFFNWGTHIEFGNIAYAEFTNYMNERFHSVGHCIAIKESTELQNLMSHVPQAINRVCARIMKQDSEGVITSEEIHTCIRLLIEERRSSAEEYFSTLTPT